MKIIVIANGKGGVAKTTTALGLAGIACASGLRVLLVDVDPQGSATLIADQRQRIRGVDMPFDLTHETDPTFLVDIRQKTSPYDFVIVDTPGSLEGQDVLAAVTRAADFMVLPSFADFTSINRVVDTVKLVRTIREVPTRVLLTKVHVQRGVVGEDARGTLSDAGVDCFTKPIRSYALYDDLQTDGSLVTEAPGRWRQGAQALSDYSATWSELTSTWLRAA